VQQWPPTQAAARLHPATTAGLWGAAEGRRAAGMVALIKPSPADPAIKPDRAEPNELSDVSDSVAQPASFSWYRSCVHATWKQQGLQTCGALLHLRDNLRQVADLVMV